MGPLIHVKDKSNESCVSWESDGKLCAWCGKPSISNGFATLTLLVGVKVAVLKVNWIVPIRPVLEVACADELPLDDDNVESREVTEADVNCCKLLAAALAKLPESVDEELRKDQLTLPDVG